MKDIVDLQVKVANLQDRLLEAQTIISKQQTLLLKQSACIVELQAGFQALINEVPGLDQKSGDRINAAMIEARNELICEFKEDNPGYQP